MKNRPYSNPHDVGVVRSTTKNPRLPCRGCGRDCKNYDICDGRPWRTLTPENTIVSNHPD